jgi:signal transduction histidine kinase
VNDDGPPSLDLPRRLKHAVDALAFLAMSLPIGVLFGVAIAGLAVGAVLSLAWIGLPIVLLAVGASLRLAAIDRHQANRLLGAHIPPLRRRERRGGSLFRRTIDTLSDPTVLRVLGYGVLKLPVSLVLLAIGAAPVLLTAELLVLGARGIASLGEATTVGPWSLGAGLGVVLYLLAVPAGVLAVAILGGLRSLQAAIARTLLAARTPHEGPVREMLAESLGDRTLSIAYWLPDREAFVDEAGRPVALPDPESGRAWTAVDRDGRRVAAIVHDADLDTTPELVHAAAAGAALAIDNERLKADLRARVEELRVSRARIVEAGDAARRRLERDLHDGAQQQLVSLALDLRVLKSRLRDEETLALVDELTAKLSVALAELRELARGIHPAILSERGLGPAVEQLGERAPMSVHVEVDVGDRLPPAIEAAAYFVVAEGLTNVVKYAQATKARVLIRRVGEDLVVAVQDDGIGGASLARGSGLRGLEDRLAALDGTLAVDSEPGEGTRLSARIPYASSPVIADA